MTVTKSAHFTLTIKNQTVKTHTCHLHFCNYVYITCLWLYKEHKFLSFFFFSIFNQHYPISKIPIEFMFTATLPPHYASGGNHCHVNVIHHVAAVLYLVLGESVIFYLSPTPLNNGFLLCYRLDNEMINTSIWTI